MPGIIFLKSDEGQEMGSFKLSDKDLRQTIAYIRGLAKSKTEAQKQSPPANSPMPPTAARYPQPAISQFGQHPQAAVPASMPQPAEVPNTPLNGPGTAGTSNARRDAMMANRRFGPNPRRSF